MEVLAPHDPMEIDLTGEGLLGAIASACDPASAFSVQVESSLRKAFEFSAGEPQRVLALLDHSHSEGALLRGTGWGSTFAARLRTAAKRRDGLASPPLFLELFLVCEVEARLRRWLRGGQDQPLDDLVRDQSEFILGYYIPRPQPSA
jgi:hypothetical protein